MNDTEVGICEINSADREWVRSFLRQHFRSTTVVSRELQCRRLWLITTNDNEPAIAFYSHTGMRLAAVHRGAISESRKLKPEISYVGIGGRPIEDEVEFELLLE